MTGVLLITGGGRGIGAAADGLSIAMDEQEIDVGGSESRYRFTLLVQRK
jgi:hypothetical protein